MSRPKLKVGIISALVVAGVTVPDCEAVDSQGEGEPSHRVPGTGGSADCRTFAIT